MVFGIRSRGKVERRSSAYDRTRGGKSKSSRNYSGGYDYSDEEDLYISSEQSYEEDTDAVDERGEYDDDYRGDNAYDERQDEEEFYEPREGERKRELVTRDQVLGELRAQAAADALGKSLEQMGYNLNNCDSFFSLSDTERNTNKRYEIEEQPSQSPQAERPVVPVVKKRRPKNKKKQKKSRPIGRYGVGSSSEEEDEETDYRRGHHRRHRDNDTFTESITEISDDDSYGDASSASSEVLSSRYIKPDKNKAKKAASVVTTSKFRKKGRSVGDYDTQYTRGTEYTDAEESSFGKTIDASSTISSVSSYSGDEETEYTEPTHRERRAKKKTDRKVRKRAGRNMRPIDEDDEALDHQPHDDKRRQAPAASNHRRKMMHTSSSSENSNIMATRSLDSWADHDNKKASKEKSSKNNAEESLKENDKIPSKETQTSSRYDRDEKSPKESFSGVSVANMKVAPKEEKSEIEKKAPLEEKSKTVEKIAPKNKKSKKRTGKATTTTTTTKIAKKKNDKSNKTKNALTTKDVATSFLARKFLSLRGKKKVESETVEQNAAVNDIKEKARTGDNKKDPEENRCESSLIENAKEEHCSKMAPQENEVKPQPPKPCVRSKLQSKKKQSSNRTTITKEAELIPELLKSEDTDTVFSKDTDNKQDSSKPEPKVESTSDQAQSKQQASFLEAAAMAAMIPLAAAYSCYNAESSQSFVKSATACAESITIAPCKAGVTDDNIEPCIQARKIDDDQANITGCSIKSSKSKHSQKSARSNTTKSSSSKNGAKNAAKDTLVDTTTPVPVGKPPHASQATSSTPDQLNWNVHAEGFESMLPGSLDGRLCRSFNGTSEIHVADPVASEKAETSRRKSLFLPLLKKAKQKEQRTAKRTSEKKNKYTKSWASKLGLGKKSADDKKVNPAEVQLPSKSISNKPPQFPKTEIPDRLPVQPNGKSSLDTDNKKATSTHHAAVQKETLSGEDTSSCRDIFDFSKLGSKEERDSFRKVTGANANKVKNNAEFDPATATEEELLKYYDLGQTFSEVVDARDTLEQAYGMTPGNKDASFDQSIDEQLVELLAHLAEMDQGDSVEMGAAIKKLKKHARKLGISERDLLFSVKSAEEIAGTMNRTYDKNKTDRPQGPSSIWGALERYFDEKK